MKSHLTLPIALFVCISSLSAQPDSLWTKFLQDTSNGYFTALDDVVGGGFIAGGFREGVYNDSTDAFWLVRFDSFGDTVWSKTYPGEGDDNVQALQTHDGGFAIGGAGDPWLIKTDANGVETWRQAISTLNDFGTIYSFEQTSDSGFIACGLVDSTGIRKALVAKTDKLGAPEWTKLYEDDYDVAGLAIVPTFDGGYAFAGVKQHPTGGGINNGWLVKLSSVGDIVWTALYGDTADAIFQGMVQSADSGFAMVGRLNRIPADDIKLNELYMVKADQDGVEEWDGFYSNGFSDEGLGVIQTADSGFAVSGISFIDTATFNIDALLVHADKAGTVDWSMTFGGPIVDAAFDVVEISAGEYLLAGGTINFDTEVAYGWIMRLGNVVIQVDEPPIAPAAYALHPNYPNPFNPSTVITFDLPRETEINLAIYDLLGREVVQLLNGNMTAGYGRIVWPGQDNNGKSVPTGVYIARLVTPEYSKSIKMVLLK